MKRLWQGMLCALALLLLLPLGAMPVAADGGSNDAIVGQDYVLQSGQQLDHDLFVLAGKVQLEPGSTVNGNVSVLAGETTVAGTVTGDVVSFGGSLELAPQAVVQGDLVAFGNVHRHPDAVVQGNTVEGPAAVGSLRELPRMLNGRSTVPPPDVVTRPTRTPAVDSISRFLRMLSTLVAILVIAALLTMLLPEHEQRVVKAMRSYWVLSLSVGVLTILLVAIVSPLLVIICIGAPVALVLLLGLALCALMGWVAAGQIVGELLVQKLNLRRLSPLTGILFGTLLISLVTTVPCVGWFVGLLLVSWGIGAVVLTRFGLQPYPAPAHWMGTRPPTPPEPPTAPQAPEAPNRRGSTHPLDPSRLLDDDTPAEPR